MPCGIAGKTELRYLCRYLGLEGSYLGADVENKVVTLNMVITTISIRVPIRDPYEVGALSIGVTKVQ